MQRQILIAIAAGLASALLYVSWLGGSLGIVLTYLMALPIFIAGLGWGMLTALLATAVLGLAIAVAIDPWVALVPVATVALPVVWICRLALLARPVDDTDSEAGIEWYPADQIVVWSAALAVALVAAGLIAVQVLGPDTQEALHAEAARFFDALREQNPDVLPAEADSDTLASLIIAVLPVALAISWMIMILFNYALARRITVASNVCQRPLTPIRELNLSSKPAFVLGAAVVVSFLPLGMIATLAGVTAAVLLIAYLLNGIAAIHAMTMGSNVRMLVLISLYTALIVFSSIGVFIAIFGIMDAFLGFRQRNAPQAPSQ